MKFYVAENGNPVGPFTVTELIARGLKSNDLVWTKGFESWVAAESVDEIREALFAPQDHDEANSKPAIPEVPSQPCPPPAPPVPQPQTPQAQPQPQPQPQYQQPQPQYQQPTQSVDEQSYEMPPKSWLVESILVTILCCLPFGIIGIIKSASINGLWQQGRYDDARKASQQAKTWTIVGAIIGLVVQVAYIVVFITMGIFDNL
jgi:type IV secretory pathway VirB10-like protein